MLAASATHYRSWWRETKYDTWSRGRCDVEVECPQALINYIRMRLGVQPRVDASGSFSKAVLYAANKFATEWMRENWDDGEHDIVAVRNAAVTQALIPTASELQVFKQIKHPSMIKAALPTEKDFRQATWWKAFVVLIWLVLAAMFAMGICASGGKTWSASTHDGWPKYSPTHW